MRVVAGVEINDRIMRGIQIACLNIEQKLDRRLTDAESEMVITEFLSTVRRRFGAKERGQELQRS